MKLWILEPCMPPSGGTAAHWPRWFDHGTVDSVVVRAETEEEARTLAQANGGAETMFSDTAWLDPTYATCKEVTVEGEAGVILTSIDR